MRYRTRTGKELGDRSIVADVTKGFSSAANTKAPIFTQVITGFSAYTIGCLAFITRNFLRIKLGERTFGLFNILLAAVLVYVVYLFIQIYGQILVGYHDENLRYNLGTNLFVFLKTIFFLPLSLWLMDECGDVYGYDGDLVFSLNFLLPDELKYFIALIVLIGAAQLVDVYIRRANKEVIHSFYRGDSVFWGWLRGKKIGRLVINDTKIWMVIEPFFVLVLAYLMYDFLEYTEFAFVLMVSAICLFMEEYKVYTETRRFTLDMLDGRLDAAYMSSVQEEYQASLEGEKESSATSYQASVGGTGSGSIQAKGSTSKFRAKLL